MFLYYLSVFILGTCVGSFLNVVLFRLERKGGILIGRSECPECLTRLQWYDLLPLISYLFLKGNCRYCKSEISLIYPLMEFTAGLAVLGYLVINGPTLNLFSVYYLSIIFLFLLLTFFDALYLILPNKITFGAIILAFAFDVIFKKPELVGLMLSGFLFSLAFAIIYLVSHGQWMGFGDVKLVFAIGLILGYPLGLLAITVAIWTAAIWGIVLILFKKANLKTALPFGSFLSAATIIFIVFKDFLTEKINAYLYFF